MSIRVAPLVLPEPLLGYDRENESQTRRQLEQIVRQVLAQGSDTIRPWYTGGNADFTVPANDQTVDGVLYFNTALTAARTITLGTGRGFHVGDTYRVVRGSGATGAFNLNVGSGPLKALATASTWCDVAFDGSAWKLTGYGAL